ncbi:MAG: CBS domain-containing protein [Thermoplasmatota archaeon]
MEGDERRIQVREVMTRSPVTVGPRKRLDSAAALMRRRSVSSLIVVNGGAPVGIVTEKDIVEKCVAPNTRPSRLTVRDVMSSPLVSVRPQTDVADAARRMASLRIRRLAVVERGRLVGILTESDILRISPGLIEITRELRAMSQHGERARPEVVGEGVCESCEAFSDELMERDGLRLCRDCADDFG